MDVEKLDSYVINIAPIGKHIIHFVSNYYEYIVYFGLTLLFAYALAFIAVQFKIFSFRYKAFFSLRHILMIVLIILQLLVFIPISYVTWINYVKPRDLVTFPDDVQFNTRWVKDDFAIYYLDNREFKSVQINGQNEQTLFTADDLIQSYFFSPNGRSALLATTHKLYLLDKETLEARLLDEVGLSPQQEQLKGSISGIRWSPDSRKICYEISRWSQFATQDTLYVYNIAIDEKSTISSPTRRLSSLYWDKQSENLYYLYHEANDTSLTDYAYDVRVYRIPLDTLKPEYVAEIPYDQSKPPLDNLLIRDIDLYVQGDDLKFDPEGKKDTWISETGRVVGIDENDYFYYQRNKWFKKKLFKIPRRPEVSEIPRYAFGGGDLVVYQFRWIPGGRYVILQHQYLGIMILEPSTGQIGQLVNISGKSYGWWYNQVQ